MKVLTLNTWQERGPWKDRWDVIFSEIKSFQPDLVFFQEVFNPDWIFEIVRRTGLMTPVYHEPTSGLAIFSRFETLASGTVCYQGQSARETYRRHLLYAKFKIADSSFFAFNTHLSWMLEDCEIRGQQTAEIADAVERIAGSGEALIAGDFNTVAWAPEIKRLTKERKFVDLYAEQYPNQPGLTWTYDNVYTREGRHPLPDRRIDYLFSRNAGRLFSKLQSVNVMFDKPRQDGVFASDHYGVGAVFQ